MADSACPEGENAIRSDKYIPARLTMRHSACEVWHCGAHAAMY